MQPSTDLYETFFKAATDAMFVFDGATKTLINANAQALKDTGYRFEELNELFIDRTGPTPVDSAARSPRTGRPKRVPPVGPAKKRARA